MGWLWLVAIGLGAFALLWFGGVPRALASFIGAALLLGGTGYAVQNQASLAGKPVRANAQGIDVDPGMVAFRAAIMPAPRDEVAILITADDRVRRGETQSAVDQLRAATDRRPGSSTIWTGLGNALVAHDHGQLSPAAEFAFRRAFQLAPDQPAAPFFLGLAYAQSGRWAAAKRAWLLALSLTPRDAPYRIIIAERLVLLDRIMAMPAARPAAR